jgi:hypothetical protein
MTGIIGLFTGAVEKVEFVSLYAQPTDGGWTLTAILRNVGTTTTSLDTCFINGVPNTQWGNAANMTPALPITLNPGNSTTRALRSWRSSARQQPRRTRAGKSR